MRGGLREHGGEAKIGFGDNVIATGLARGAAARGKRVAFGDGKTILWDHNSEDIFKNNPNIAPPGSEGESGLEWIPFYRGNRGYNRQSADGSRWIWNYQFRPNPGEIFFDEKELREATKHGSGFVIIEPAVPHWKSSYRNKDWGQLKYWKVAKKLKRAGYDVRQFQYGHGGHNIEHCTQIKTRTFRQAVAILARAALFIGPEGGMHHAAAAVGIPAVVLFGGFIPPSVSGYETHTNLTGGAQACGSLKKCDHCLKAMENITVGDVEAAAIAWLKKTNTESSAALGAATISGSMVSPIS